MTDEEIETIKTRFFESDLDKSCAHEAGHSTVANAYGVRNTAEVYPNLKLLENVELYRVDSMWNGRMYFLGKTKKRMSRKERQAVAVAGAVGEMLHEGVRATDDLEDCWSRVSGTDRKLAGWATDIEPEVHGAFYAAVAKALRLLDGRVRHEWRTIAACLRDDAMAEYSI